MDSIWKSEITYNILYEGKGSLCSTEWDDSIEGFIQIDSAGWCHITTRGGIYKSFSPALQMEVTWDKEEKV